LQAGLLVHKLLAKSGVIHFHAHFAHSPTSVALFASCLSGLPFSFTAHAKDIYTSDRRQLAEKIHLARFVVTCTDYNRKYLKGLASTGRTPIYRVYHGIDVGLFAAPPVVATPAAPFRILTVARLTEKKGIPTILEAVRQLVDRGIKVCYTIIGDGDQRQQILSLIRTLCLEGVCRWLGTRPHHEVLEHYRNSDLFALGCQVADNGDRDGIPNVLMESMAMGVPVVATEVSAISELITHGRTGLLVPPQRPDRLADAMQRLLTDAPMRAAIIPPARQLVHQAFDNRALIRSLAQIYRRHIDFEKNL
jgi:glycosyltransferase involved in cell wall biosynthesis